MNGRQLTERMLREAEGKPRRSVTVNLAESPLGWLGARGLVSARQLEAGERLRADYERGGLSAKVTMRWEPRSGGAGARAPGADPTIAAIEAKRRFDAAIAAVGSGLADVLWRVACAGEGLEAAERALGWPRRAGKIVLLMALDRLAAHYALP